MSTSAIAAHNQQDPLGPLDPSRLHYPSLHQYQEHQYHPQPHQHLPQQVLMQQGHHQAYTLGHQYLQGYGQEGRDYKRRSQPGPQVPTSTFQQHQQLYVQQQLYSVQQQEDGKGNHIYMEVDPLYSTHLPHSETQTELLSSPSEEELGCSTPGLVSSNSSQSSSGYSTAPSEQYCYADQAKTAALFNNLKGASQVAPVSVIQRVASNQLLPSQYTKDQVFSISQVNQDSINCFDRSQVSESRDSKRKQLRKAVRSGNQEHPLIFLEESQVI